MVDALPRSLKWLCVLEVGVFAWVLSTVFKLKQLGVLFGLLDAIFGLAMIPVLMVVFLVAWCLGPFLALRLQNHPTRRNIWGPLGLMALFAILCFCLDASADWAAVFPAGMAAGLIAIPIQSAWAAKYPPGTPVPVRAENRRTRTLIALGFLGIFGMWFIAFRSETEVRIRWATALLAGAAGITGIVSFWFYRRPVGETLGEWLFRLMYRMRAVGPGMQQLPRTGAVLVIANHTAYLDPCWVMICLPRDLTPIMFGDYFKWFGLHFYMKHIINAIPSGVGAVRREAPELDEVVRRLDRCEGILIFPEGWVRRKEEDSVRRFAQGAWRILRDRPATPVVACWIEGGWGSWSSFWHGPPFVGKRMDIRRPIDIGVSAPAVLDAETLADQHRTRELLRQMVLDARKHLK